MTTTFERLRAILIKDYKFTPDVLVLEAHQADPVSLVRFNKVLMTRSAVAKIEEVLV